MIEIPKYATDRATVCRDCDRLFAPTWTCKECGCFMKIKVLLPSATCPLDRWV